MKSERLEESWVYQETLFAGIHSLVGYFCKCFVYLLRVVQCSHRVVFLFFFSLGPGLAIRIICGEEPYQGMDFAETNIILGQIVDFVTAIKKVRLMGEINLF